MNLLLLLSALLSAITGVSTGARVETPQAVSQTLVDAAPAALAATTAQVRLVQGVADLRDVAVASAAFSANMLRPFAALLTNRRRE